MTLLEAFYKCRWPDEQSMSAGEIAEVEDATRTLLAEAKRLGRRLRSFPEDVVDEAAQVFIYRFCRNKRKAELDSDARVSGFVYTAVLRNCRSLRRGHGPDQFALDPDELAALATTEATPESAARTNEAERHLEDARELLPGLLDQVVNRLSTMSRAEKAASFLDLSASKFSEVSSSLVSGDSPASGAERRAFQRSFQVLRALLPLACLDAGLAPPAVVDLLLAQGSLRDQLTLLHGDETSAMIDVDPRLKWVFAVAESWRARYSE